MRLLGKGYCGKQMPKSSLRQYYPRQVQGVRIFPLSAFMAPPDAKKLTDKRVILSSYLQSISASGYWTIFIQ